MWTCFTTMGLTNMSFQSCFLSKGGRAGTTGGAGGATAPPVFRDFHLFFLKFYPKNFKSQICPSIFAVPISFRKIVRRINILCISYWLGRVLRPKLVFGLVENEMIKIFCNFHKLLYVANVYCCEQLLSRSALHASPLHNITIRLIESSFLFRY